MLLFAAENWNGVDVVPLIFEYDGWKESVEEATARTLSHMTRDHLFSNVQTFVMFCIPLTLLQRNRIVIPQLLGFLALNLVTIHYYINGIGFSLVVFAVYGCALISTMYVAYYVIQDGRWIRDKVEAIIFYSILLVFFGGSSVQLTVDALLVLDVITLDELPLFGNLIGDVSDNYGLGSSKAHVIGFIGGIVTSTLLVLVHRFTCLTVFRIEIP